ncbi:M10 family metallopeptidase C-terminal domain-containing protein [uncultured Rhodoblastus sp.]|uniref:M10 family metallopeptidase C-terminal domain-containing protein n=1 Tax=uncultured Rhodoblastus sp. TaxID=543037 RepID=UPI0025FB4604|nr:M10 family metallopeptidase C-terminal domain-containing protein [uncultured Rhodoblastus sp.]
MVRVVKAGAVLNGIDFGSATVQIMANNVTIENCTFTGTTGWYAVDQLNYVSGAVVKNNSFINPELSLKEAAVILSRTPITILNNTFIDTPGDGIDMTSGIVSGNYFSGAGYTSNGTHPDAIWISDSLGPTVITNNFIDWSPNPTSTFYTNDCVRVTTELGNAQNITISGNYMFGGSCVIDAGNTGKNGIFSNIDITDNYIGFAGAYDFYPGPQTGVTKSGNVIFDFTNPVYSTNAWDAYKANGIVTNWLVTQTGGANSIYAASTGSTTLYGASKAGSYLNGGAGETIFIGGAGIQGYWGGSGKNIFSYLSIADSYYMGPDMIGNFHVATDVIDLHAINANPASPSGGNFTFIGSAPFSSAGGEVRVVQDVAKNQTYVQADMAGGSSPELIIRFSGLLNLTASNFALTTEQYNAAIAASTTMASFQTSQASLDHVAGGFSIVDSLANIQPGLDALQADAGHINSVTSISGVIAVNAATFVADQTILDKFAGGFSVVDAGANLLARIGALNSDAGHINAVTSTSGAVVVNAATFAANQSILDKFAGGFSVVDAGAKILVRIGALNSHAGHINAVTSTSGPVAVNASTFVGDQTILDKFSGGFSVVDAGANLLAQIGALNSDAGHINAVTSTSGPIAVNVATFLADRTILDKVVGGFVVSDTGANIVAQIGALTSDAGHINALNSTSGVLGVSAATFAANQTILDKTTGGFAVVDKGASILAQIDALENDADNIDAVTSTNGLVAVNTATFLADQNVLDKFTGGFTVKDTGANILAQIGVLESDAGSIASVTLSDSTAGSPDVLTLSASDAAADAAILSQIVSPYILDATDASGATATGHGSGLNFLIGGAALSSGPGQPKLTVTGGGSGETFLFSSNFGSVEITDFANYQGAVAPDKIYLSTADFANWPTLLAHGQQIGANTVFTAEDGASLTLDGVSLTSLTASGAAQTGIKFYHA